MAWLGIIGLVLLVLGLIVPLFGPMLGRNFGLESFAITAVGLVLFALHLLLRRPPEDPGASEGSYGDAADSSGSSDHGGHDGGDGDAGGH